jgi:hypothetical protein
MAVTTGTVHSVDTLVSDAVTPLQLARIKFTMSGTYAQGDNSILTGIGALISGSRRNGRTVTLVDCMVGAPATKASSATAIMALKTVAIASADITFELTDGDYTTELGAGTIPAQDRPFELLVAFTEA